MPPAHPLEAAASSNVCCCLCSSAIVLPGQHYVFLSSPLINYLLGLDRDHFSCAVPTRASGYHNRHWPAFRVCTKFIQDELGIWLFSSRAYIAELTKPWKVTSHSGPHRVLGSFERRARRRSSADGVAVKTIPPMRHQSFIALTTSSSLFPTHIHCLQEHAAANTVASAPAIRVVSILSRARPVHHCGEGGEKEQEAGGLQGPGTGKNN